MEQLEQGFACLDAKAWSEAAQCFRQVLAMEPENPRAHLGNLLADLHARNVDELKNCPFRFDNRMSYQNALPYLEPDRKTALDECIAQINRRNETDRLRIAYEMGLKRMQTAGNETAFLEAAGLFAKISGYRDASAQEDRCRDLAEASRKDAVVAKAVFWMAKDRLGDYRQALELLESVPGWKTADRKAQYCRNRIRQFLDIERREQQWKERVLRGVIKTLRIALPAVAAGMMLAVLLVWVFQPSVQYRKAMAQIESGNIVDAYETLVSLRDFKDSAEKAESIHFLYKQEMIRRAQPGDYVDFGEFTQTSDDSGLMADINWLVLAREENRILVLSRLALNSMGFHAENVDVTWKDCTLRSWLNEEFYPLAFSDEEKAMVALTDLEDEGTQDRVFLLNVEEVEKYLPNKPDRWLDPTLYAVKQGAWQHDNTYRCWWWLRTSGEKSAEAIFVGTEGTIQYTGGFVYRYAITVRPAMWIEIP